MAVHRSGASEKFKQVVGLFEIDSAPAAAVIGLHIPLVRRDRFHIECPLL
jgi:hypothetical protein